MIMLLGSKCDCILVLVSSKSINISYTHLLNYGKVMTKKGKAKKMPLIVALNSYLTQPMVMAMFDRRICVQCNKVDIFGCCTIQSRNREILTITAITFDSSCTKRPNQVAHFANQSKHIQKCTS
jgi:hypothetical protein